MTLGLGADVQSARSAVVQLLYEAWRLSFVLYVEAAAWKLWEKYRSMRNERRERKMRTGTQQELVQLDALLAVVRPFCHHLGGRSTQGSESVSRVRCASMHNRRPRTCGNCKADPCEPPSVCVHAAASAVIKP